MRRKAVMGGIALVAVSLTVLWLAAGSMRGGNATRQAADELEELRTISLPAMAEAGQAEPEDTEPYERVLEHFYRTQDARYVEPSSGMSMLQLACLFKKAELVRCLLLDGADPHAQEAGDDSPLLLAVSTWPTPQADTKQITAVVDTLLAGGADMSKSGHGEGDFLTLATMHCENEDVLLHLMEKGAEPNEETAVYMALHGWARALEATLKQQPGTEGLMHAAARGVAFTDGEHVACMELLLKKGVQAQQEAEGQPGITPLYLLARELSDMAEDNPHREQAIHALKWLLEHGADAYLRTESDEEYSGFCPYDLLAMNPDLLAQLRAQGIDLPAPPPDFTPGNTLPQQVLRAALSRRDPETLAPHFDTIATLFTPASADLAAQEIYTQAVAAAVPLLASIDPQRAARAIEKAALWHTATPAEPGVEPQDALAALVQALQDHEDVALSEEFICKQAEELITAGRAGEASGLIELLARCPGAQASIERYCNDPRPPLQAGGYAAKLNLASLPDARNNGVTDWLQERHRTADTPFLQEAVLLTSPEKMWYGQMPPEEQQKMIALMRKIGADAAAKVYEQLVRMLDKPEELDTLFSHGDDWMYELETAIARHFLTNQQQFTPATAP